MANGIARLAKAEREMDAYAFYELYAKQEEALKLAWNRFAAFR